MLQESDWAIADVTSSEPGSFGCDPSDSAALLRLREAIDEADVWPDPDAMERGDYEASVRHMAALVKGKS